jgi:hypothetical protein
LPSGPGRRSEKLLLDDEDEPAPPEVLPAAPDSPVTAASPALLAASPPFVVPPFVVPPFGEPPFGAPLAASLAPASEPPGPPVVRSWGEEPSQAPANDVRQAPNKASGASARARGPQGNKNFIANTLKSDEASAELPK